MQEACTVPPKVSFYPTRGCLTCACMCSVPAWERTQAARDRMSEDSTPAQRLRDLRDKLCMLLEESDLYDARHVLQRIGATELWDEQVVLHSKVRAPLEN